MSAQGPSRTPLWQGPLVWAWGAHTASASLTWDMVGMPVLGAYAHVPNRKLRARLGFEQVSQVTVVHVLDWERDVG